MRKWGLFAYSINFRSIVGFIF